MGILIHKRSTAWVYCSATPPRCHSQVLNCDGHSMVFSTETSGSQQCNARRRSIVERCDQVLACPVLQTWALRSAGIVSAVSRI